MKIKGTCRRCGREFLAEQVILNGGHCPWDGKPFQADYAVVLVDSLTDAESAGNTLENALEKLADIEPEFVLDIESVLAEIRGHLERLERPHGGREGVTAVPEAEGRERVLGPGPRGERGRGASRSSIRGDARSRPGLSRRDRGSDVRLHRPTSTSPGSRSRGSARSTGSPRGRDVGFNAMQPGKLKRGDLIFFAIGVAVIVALIVWAVS